MNGEFNSLDFLSIYDYIVYDECHYFYSDSNFNTYTHLSYDFFRNKFCAKIQIFMSATIDNMSNYINDFYSDILYGQNNKPVFHMNHITYELTDDYDYIDVNYFSDISSLISIIGNSGDKNKKWLIFTDSIKHGKILKKEIQQNSDNINEDDIIFIDAKYRNDESTFETVSEIAKTNQMNKRIIISTSVMDNGISIKDIELRNLVILCDTKEQFIQMIGRKRNNGNNQRVNLYLHKRDSSHFKQRFQYFNRIREFYNEHKNALDRIPLNDQYVLFYNQQILKSIFRHENFYYYAKAVLYPYNGIIHRNIFSINRCENLCLFYGEMEKKIELDGDAFLDEQLSWLNIDKSKATDVSRILSNGATNPNIKRLQEVIEKEFGKAGENEPNRIVRYERKDYIEFSKSLRKYIKYLYSVIDGVQEINSKELDNLKTLKLYNRYSKPVL